MKYEVVPNSCRICLRKSKKQRSIYKPLEEGDEPPNEMLKLITGISLAQATDSVELPKNICKSCELALNLAFQFRNKALKSQKIIEIFCNLQSIKDSSIDEDENISFKMLKNEGDNIADVKQEEEVICKPLEQELELVLTQEMPTNSSIEMKVEELELPFSDDAKIEYLDDDSYDDEYDAIYSSADEQPLSNMQQEQRELKDAANISDNAPASSETQQENIEELRKELDSLEKLMESKQPGNKALKKRAQKNGSKRGRKPKYDIEELKQRLIDSEKYTLVEVKNKEPGAAPTLKLRAKKSGRPRINDESGHICDICGNIYAKRGRMMEHRRRHDKELRFPCELCDKRFHLREKLRKHMFSHSGGKPYQCSFCSRTFFYESVKKAHEAVHKGVKPYICEVCNKAFAYSHALKKHKLIHAEIKLYHCDYCDKDFRLQHHMKQHEETKMHQNAVKSMDSVQAAVLTANIV